MPASNGSSATWLTLDATYFYNRYYDLIVTLGGSLTTLSHYQSANLANSQAQGAELSAGLRPAPWLLVTGSYTLLETRLSRSMAPAISRPALCRRTTVDPPSRARGQRGRLLYPRAARRRTLRLLPRPHALRRTNFGASNGLFWNPGFANVGVNLNYTLGRGVTAYGNLRNALNRQYEEVFGFPSPKLNFVAGLKWTIARTQ